MSSILYVTDRDARPCVMPGMQEEAAEKIAFSGFSLADYGPPSFTLEVALGLT